MALTNKGVCAVCGGLTEVSRIHKSNMEQGYLDICLDCYPDDSLG